jgi:hypothetical protein
MVSIWTAKTLQAKDINQVIFQRETDIVSSGNKLLKVAR